MGEVRKSLGNLVLAALLVAAVQPAEAATVQQVQAVKAERAVKVLQNRDFEGLKSFATRKLLYQSLGPDLAGNEILQAQLAPYREQDQEFLACLTPVVKEPTRTDAKIKTVPTTPVVTEVEPVGTIRETTGGNSEVQSGKTWVEPEQPVSYKVEGEQFNKEDWQLNRHDGLNFGEGHGTIYVGAEINPDFTASGTDAVGYFDFGDTAATRFTGNAVVGLDGKSAIGYRFHRHGYAWSNYYGNATYQDYDANVTSHELDYLYKVAPGLALTAGLHHDKIGIDVTARSGSVSFDNSRVSWTAGLLGRWYLNDWLTFNAAAGAGPKLVRFDVGLGFNVAPNTELYLGYENYLYRSFNIDAGSRSYEAETRISGFNAGLNFRF